MSRKLVPIAVITIGLGAVVLAAILETSRPDQIAPVFEGVSTDLERTRIIATVDAPFDPAKNTIWCASMVAAWKALENDVLGGPVEINRDIARKNGMSIESVYKLNAAADPTSTINPADIYAAAGRIDEGIIQTIYDGLGEKFPNKLTPEFSKMGPLDIVAYAYLQVELKFQYPYPVNPEPLHFTNADGGETPVRSFGMLNDKHGTPGYGVQSQPRVLFQFGSDGVLTEFAIDLDKTSLENEIIVALVPPDATLKEMIEGIARNTKNATAADEMYLYMQPEILHVPDTVWRITHHFEELLGLWVTNDSLGEYDYQIRRAQQDTYFRLDSEGAILESEAIMEAAAESAAYELPSVYIFDRPFLILMRKRGESMPYFAMWVANDELLNRW